MAISKLNGKIHCISVKYIFKSPGTLDYQNQYISRESIIQKLFKRNSDILLL